ncbi:MAG: SDR family oxidoreductase [Planctomycetota bacterium]
MGRFDGKTALVTGANSGIGKETARRLIAEGARVIVTGRREGAIREAAEELGPNAIPLVADAGVTADNARLVSEVKSRFGAVDAVFLNAGIAPFVPIEVQEEAAFDQLFAINVKGPYFTLQALLPVLKDGASVLMNTSVVDVKGMPNSSAYSMTKAALRSLVRVAASELSGRGIRVNAVSPGPIATPIFGKMDMSQEEQDAMGAGIQQMVPLGRFGEASELAAAAAFLLSDDASYIQGAELAVDGGMAQV